MTRLQDTWDTLTDGLDEKQQEVIVRLVKAQMIFLTELVRVSEPEAVTEP